MATERFNVIFKDYPEEFNVSEHRMKKYWLRKDEPKLILKHKKSLAAGSVIWKKMKNGKEALYDITAMGFIPKNPRTAGTPRIQKINAQMLWQSGYGTEWVRMKMRDYLHGWFVPGIVRQMPDEIFTKPGEYIHFEYIFYYPFADKHHWELYQDYLNHAFIYSKTFEDTLVELKILKSDSPRYMRGGYARYVDIMDMEDNQDRRLEIKIHFCKNNERIS